MAMANKRVLILSANKNLSFILRSVQTELENHDVDVVVCGATVTEISRVTNIPHTVFISAEEFSKGKDEELMYLKEFVSAHDSTITIIGHPNDIEDLSKRFPKNLICATYARPIEVQVLAFDLDKKLNLLSTRDNKKHILVVDDSGMMLRTIMGWLEGIYKISLANSAATAFTFLSKEKPDLILLDYEMPVCNGPQFFEMLKAEEATADIPVIFLTSKGDAESVKAVVALKPQGYILKTTPEEQVIDAIDDFFLSQKKHNI